MDYEKMSETWDGSPDELRREWLRKSGVIGEDRERMAGMEFGGIAYFLENELPQNIKHRLFRSIQEGSGRMMSHGYWATA